ncbi:hypothetical protein [Mycobacterium sp. shizuoka-1]|uniref:hypothetical protein n=1 Tax=Mycobacterium sp. shizuoka-1 TaxID=2039281 RepID=UPI000C065192|nr:hypothetical protein [Mycobacterium sp. shizuoka-1]GAY17392.1 hypothetical protein MSZK_41180 [Mycobacterium sp. shizuoka-1]
MNDGDSARGELLPTVGLLLIFASVVGFALFLSSVGTSSGPSGYAAGVTVVAFLASLACFAADGRDSEERLGAPAREAMATGHTV